MVFVGNNGRKGPKKDETVLGTAIEYLSLNSTFPCVIIKDRKARTEKPDGALRYGVCFDSSEKSKKALSVVLNMMRTGDKLVTITVKCENMLSEDDIKTFVKDETAKVGVTKIEMIFLEKEANLNIYEVIKKYL